jgi:hypothetical protein
MPLVWTEFRTEEDNMSSKPEAEREKDFDQEENRVKSQTGDPGRTPGSAEGDRETVEEDLEDWEDESE